jgi:hypothetical protein
MCVLENDYDPTMGISFQDLLTRHKILSAEFLEQNYDKVFQHYQQLLNSDNYVTRRQALKVRRPVLVVFSVGRSNRPFPLVQLTPLDLGE